MDIITFIGQLAATISLTLGIVIIAKSWRDCGSDHEQGNSLTYPGDQKKEVN